MERREFLKIGGASATLGLSGCIEPVQDIINKGEPSDNNTNNTNDTDNNTTDDKDDEQPEVLVYRDFIPENGYGDSDGVLAIHVELGTLETQYTEPYSAYDGLPLEENEVALSTGNALLSVEPVVRDSIGQHPLRSDLLSALGFKQQEGNFSVSEYVLIEDVLLCRADVTPQMLENTYGLTEVDDSGELSIYANTTGSNYVGFNGTWLAVPLTSSGSQSLLQDVNETVSNGGLYDGEFGSAFGDREDGTVNVAAWKDGLNGVLSENSSEVSGIASSASFEGGVETVTGVLFSNGVTDFADDVGRGANTRSETQDGSVVTVTTTWS